MTRKLKIKKSLSLQKKCILNVINAFVFMAKRQEKENKTNFNQ